VRKRARFHPAVMWPSPPPPLLVLPPPPPSLIAPFRVRAHSSGKRSKSLVPRALARGLATATPPDHLDQEAVQHFGRPRVARLPGGLSSPEPLACSNRVADCIDLGAGSSVHTVSHPRPLGRLPGNRSARGDAIIQTGTSGDAIARRGGRERSGSDLTAAGTIAPRPPAGPGRPGPGGWRVEPAGRIGPGPFGRKNRVRPCPGCPPGAGSSGVRPSRPGFNAPPRAAYPRSPPACP